jgi:hypothetical protein
MRNTNRFARVDGAADRLIVFEAGAQILAVEEDVVPLRDEREIQALREGALLRRIAQEDLQGRGRCVRIRRSL